MTQYAAQKTVTDQLALSMVDLDAKTQKAKGDEVLDDFADSFSSEYGENSEYYTTGCKTWWNKLIDDIITPALNQSCGFYLYNSN